MTGQILPKAFHVQHQQVPVKSRNRNDSGKIINKLLRLIAFPCIIHKKFQAMKKMPNLERKEPERYVEYNNNKFVNV